MFTSDNSWTENKQGQRESVQVVTDSLSSRDRAESLGRLKH